MGDPCTCRGPYFESPPFAPARKTGLYSEPTDYDGTKAVARIPISCVHDNFSVRTVTLTKSMTILTNPPKATPLASTVPNRALILPRRKSAKRPVWFLGSSSTLLVSSVRDPRLHQI